MAVVVTVAKGYDLGYVWKNQGQAAVEQTTGGYYINAAQAGEPAGRWWGPGAKALGFAVGQVVGYIGQFTRSDLPEVSYELGPKFWGKGFATTALGQFVSGIDVRPLYARAVKDNARSIGVLRKCGFSTVGEGRFIAAGGHEVEELIFALDHS